MNSVSQPRIAFLGATGGTGSATLRSLLARQDHKFQLQIFVRSKAKLLRLFPELEASPTSKIWEGQLDNVDTMKDCLRGADIIICTLGENQDIPGLHVLQDGARSMMAALDLLQTEDGWKKPRLIFLSSATLNARFAAATPAPMIWILRTAFCHPYADLLAAQAIFTAKPHLLSLLLVQPPAIVEDDATGHEISTESVRLAVSYADLGAAFAELALERSYDKLGAVGVSSQGGDAFGKYGLELASRMVIGLLAGYVPGYWSLAALLKNWC
ncbi:putative NAD(P)-binding domain-containing protein [Seiridium cardinale]